jgi:hypothetical protein
MGSGKSTIRLLEAPYHEKVGASAGTPKERKEVISAVA